MSNMMTGSVSGSVSGSIEFSGGGASLFSLIDAIRCVSLIYTPFGGLQSRGAGLARLAGVFVVGAPLDADL